ncbi:MAG: NAD(P)H-hydrate epimerase [Gemmiger sp.]
MRFASTEQMKEIDRAAIQGRGISSLLLMENAAAAVTRAVLEQLAASSSSGVTVLCGPGNNGGDGLACARQLLAQGIRVRAILVGDPGKMTQDAIVMARRLEQTGGTLERWSTAAPGWQNCGCLVDALFGVGLCREVKGEFRDAVAAANEAGVPIVSCDIPSGLHGDTGAVLGTAIRAAQTVTFSCAKPGLVQGQGPQYAGVLTVAQIGIPADLLPQE